MDIPADRINSASNSLSHTRGSYACLSEDGKHRFQRELRHGQDATSVQQTIEDVKLWLKEGTEATIGATGDSRTPSEDSRAENTSLRRLVLEPQTPASAAQRARRKSTHDYHEAISEIDALKIPSSSRSSFRPDKKSPLSTSTSSTTPLEVDSPSLVNDGQVSKRPLVANHGRQVSSNDGANTERSNDRFAASPTFERQSTRQSSSSSSSPLRMEQDECASISYSLKLDHASSLKQSGTTRPTPTTRRSCGSETPPAPGRDAKMTFAPHTKTASPARADLERAKASGTDEVDWQQVEQQKLASQILLRRQCSGRFELDRNHPAWMAFAGDAASLDQVGDANVGESNAWPKSPGQASPADRRPKLPPHGAKDSYELAKLEADDKVPERLNERPARQGYTLRHRRHFSLEPHKPFNLSKAHKRAPIARDWSTGRKRFVASVACISTALMGMVIGIYAGEVPAIQYAVVDQHRQVILGNVVFFLGLAIPTTFLYPLPLLHGRKPYTLAALTILLPLQFPPAVIVSQQRSPDIRMYRVGLLLSRALAGIAMGFANINFFGTLLDLFGSSLMSDNPHQETVIEYDPRRHGGGMGLWLGIWTWCFLGSLGLGFFVGAIIVSGLNVAWGFWIIIVLTVIVLMLNVVAPEVRRSAYRKSMAEVRNGNEVSRRVARGEIMMHLYSTGPLHWWEEVAAGIHLNGRMLKQPGFFIMAVYVGWMYAQVVLVIILLGALTSRYYRFYPQDVALCVASVPIGALLAVPFQKAGIFSRARSTPQRTDSMTFQKRVTWTSHLIRRAFFMIALPLAGVGYTLSSAGPPIPAAVPSVFAGLVGFLSALALAECVGLIMETFDVSDLQPGMTGRRRSVVPEVDLRRRANYSCFPRVVSALACAQGIAFVLAACATAWGGNVERAVGAQTATGIVAAILLLLTLALVLDLTRLKSVQVIPRNRLDSVALRGPGEDLPVIIGHPSGINRRISWLELGHWTRWQEIRRRNGLL